MESLWLANERELRNVPAAEILLPSIAHRPSPPKAIDPRPHPGTADRAGDPTTPDYFTWTWKPHR